MKETLLGKQLSTATPSAEWKDDPSKTAEENAAAKTIWEAEQKAKAEAAKANDTKLTPFTKEELKVGEGITLDPGLVEDFVKLVNETGLPRDVVGKFTEFHNKVLNTISDKDSADWATTVEQWEKDVVADKELGGLNLPKTLSTVGRLMDEYGTPALRQALNLTGAGNHPDVVKFFHKIALKLGEPPVIPSGQPGTNKLPLEQRIYNHPTS